VSISDPDLFSGKLMSDSGAMQVVERNKLLYYQGGHHGSCVQIREALNVLMRDRQIAPQAGGRVRLSVSVRLSLSLPARLLKISHTCSCAYTSF
jgi:hypothetical protein